jgi:hypothetical protein
MRLGYRAGGWTPSRQFRQEFVESLDDTSWDAEIAAETTQARAMTGKDVGTTQFGSGTSPTPVDTEVRAHSGELLLLLWNRRHADGLTVEGRTDVLDIWAREAHL